jgi:hypothetical protein
MDEIDDSKVSIAALVQTLVRGEHPASITRGMNGGLLLDGEAENDTDQEEKEIAVGEGTGKRRRVANRWYQNDQFWRHNDDEGSDVDEA